MNSMTSTRPHFHAVDPRSAVSSGRKIGWGAFWCALALTSSSALVFLTWRYGWHASGLKIVDGYSLIRTCLTASLFMSLGGCLYCLARVNENTPGHDNSTAKFLDFIGYGFLLFSFCLTSHALYISAWKLPRYGWEPEVLWFDRNNQSIANPIESIAFSPDETQLIARHENGRLQVWTWWGNEIRGQSEYSATTISRQENEKEFVIPGDRGRLVIRQVDGTTKVEIVNNDNGSTNDKHSFLLPFDSSSCQAVFSRDGTHVFCAMDESVCLLRLP